MPVLRQHELGDRALGPGTHTGDGARGAAVVHRGDRFDVRGVPPHPRCAAHQPLRVRVERGDQRGRGEGHAAVAATDADAFVAERGARDRPPVVDGTDDVVVGHEHVGEEHFVEVGAAGDLAQRPHLDTLRVHVDHHRGDAVVLRHVGIGAHGGEAEGGLVRTAGPHLLTVDEPTPVDTGGLRLHPGGVGTRVGLAEELAPDELLVERRLHPPAHLVGRRVLHQREDHPAGDPVVRLLDACGAELLFDDELLDRAGCDAIGLGPVRYCVAAAHQLATTGVVVECRELGDQGLHPGADRLGLRRQVDGARELDALAESVGDVGAGVIGVDHGGDVERAAQVEMGIVLPGEADAAVHLNVEVGAEVRRGHRERRGHGNGEGELVGAGSGARGIPHGSSGKFRGDEHVRAVVLDGLEGGDRAPELDPLLRVLGGHVGGLAGNAGGLGREDQPGEVDERVARTGQHLDGRVGEGDLAGAAGVVDVLGQLDRHAPAAQVDDNDVVTRRHERDAREAGADHGAGVTRRDIAGHRERTAEADRGERGTVGEAGEQAGLHVRRRRRGEQGRRHHRGHEGTGRDLTAQLLHDHDELLQPEARSTVLLGEVQAEPTELDQQAPEGRERFCRRLQQCAGGATRIVGLQEVGGDIGEREMVVGDGNRHGSLQVRGNGRTLPGELVGSLGTQRGLRSRREGVILSPCSKTPRRTPSSIATANPS